jgi:hypothetical protein
MVSAEASPLPAAFRPSYGFGMTQPTPRSLWPDSVRRPFQRLILALVLAPLLVAALLTFLAFLAAGSTEPTREATMKETREAAVVFFVALPAFSLTAGAIAVAGLWLTGHRGTSAWALAGAAVGSAVALIQQVLRGSIWGLEIAVAVALGSTILFLVHWIAGVRPG